jgi:hypothetical protein
MSLNKNQNKMQQLGFVGSGFGISIDFFSSTFYSELY